jgi:uncharacterized membrane protein
VDWLDVIEAVRASEKRVTRMFYHEARPELFDLGNGVNACVVLGDPGYQTTDGEIVTL